MQNIKIGFREIILSSGSWRIKILKIIDLILGSFLTIFLKEKKAVLIPSDQIRSILIIRPGGIGDAIFLLPFLCALKQKPQSMNIDILCEKRNAQVFLSQRSIYRRVYCYDQPKSFLSIFKNKYDIAIDTEQWHYLSAIISYVICPQNVGFATRPRRRRLFNQPIEYENDAYEITNFQRLFNSFLAETQRVENINSCFQVSGDCLTWAEEKIPEKSICVFLGASIPERRFTKEQCLAIVRFILGKGLRVVMLGGSDVLRISQCVKGEIGDNRLLNLVGQTTLGQSAALIKRSALFVGPDSGLMHLACAVGAPVVAIFGPGNEKKWAPRGEHHAVIHENTKDECYTHFGYTILPHCYQGTANIDIRNIFAAIERKIQQ